jgi:hypothetical protein
MRNPRRSVQIHESRRDDPARTTITLIVYRRKDGLKHGVGREYTDKEAALSRTDVRAETIRALVRDWRRYRRSLSREIPASAAFSPRAGYKSR